MIKNIFERLCNGETIPANDPEGYKMLEASYKTKKLVVQMNNATEPEEIRSLLSQITETEIHEDPYYKLNMRLLQTLNKENKLSKPLSLI